MTERELLQQLVVVLNRPSRAMDHHALNEIYPTVVEFVLDIARQKIRRCDYCRIYFTRGQRRGPEARFCQTACRVSYFNGFKDKDRRPTFSS